MALRDITLGQYFPGTSLIHRFDPRSKLIFVLLYIVAVFLSKSPVVYGALFSLLMLGIVVSRVKPRLFMRGLKPVLLIATFTAVMNLFFNQSGTILWQWNALHITTGGISFAAFMVVRILMLLLSTLLLTYTTSPLMLTDGLDRLLSPLKKLRVPVEDFTMIMSLALRFIPTLMQETEKIMSAQKARGADFETGNIIRRAKALIPILIPLFISSFRRAEELAVAMDCRCYGSPNPRTRLKQPKFALRDIGLTLLACALLAGVIVLRQLNFFVL